MGYFVGRVSYKNQPIFCRPIKSADFIIRLSSAYEAILPHSIFHGTWILSV